MAPDRFADAAGDDMSRAAASIYEEVDEAKRAVAARVARVPRVGLVLGTGLGGVVEILRDAIAISYEDIPHFPRPTVLGHVGRLVVGTLHGVPVAALQGRFHLYEGYSPRQVIFPVRVLRALGCEVLLVTNAAGGLNPAFGAGTLMLVRDSIGLPMLAGLNPLIGPNDERLGPRFPPLVGAYDVELRRLARAAAAEAGIALEEGIYVMVAGPTYEAPAESRFLRLIGADAVGMSTVPEVIAARHQGMRVLAISCITNVAPTDSAAAGPAAAVAHGEVVQQAEAVGPRLGAVLAGVVGQLAP